MSVPQHRRAQHGALTDPEVNMLIGRQAPLALLATAFAALGAQPGTASAPPTTLVRRGEQLEQVIKRYETSRSEVSAKMNAAESMEERARIYEAAPWQAFVGDFREVAYESGGSDTAVQAWIWVVRTGKEFLPEDAHEAVENLLAAHIDSPRISDLIDELSHPQGLGSEFAEETLTTIAAKSPERAVQASAQFRLATALMGEGDGSEERRGRAHELLVSMRSEYKGLLADKEIERTLYELEHLQIGMQAPEFEAIDADGAAFKLSDYRGKVVVVDFWGFW